MFLCTNCNIYLIFLLLACVYVSCIVITTHTRQQTCHLECIHFASI